MTPDERNEILKLLRDDIEGQGSSSVRWAIHQITKSTNILDTQVDKVSAKLIEDFKYIKEKRDFSHGYDFTVMKNPDYKTKKFFDNHPTLEKIFIAALSGIISLIVALTISKSQKRESEQLEYKQEFSHIPPKFEVRYDSILFERFSKKL